MHGRSHAFCHQIHFNTIEIDRHSDSFEAEIDTKDVIEIFVLALDNAIDRLTLQNVIMNHILESNQRFAHPRPHGSGSMIVRTID